MWCMTAAQPWPRYACVRCGRDWTTDLENIAYSPEASIDNLCECDQRVVAEGTAEGVAVIMGLVAKEP